MSWEDTLRKNVFDKDPNDMTDFMNVSPRMKREAERRGQEKDKNKIKPDNEKQKEIRALLVKGDTEKAFFLTMKMLQTGDDAVQKWWFGVIHNTIGKNDVYEIVNDIAFGDIYLN